jgi:hypothetical protein
MEYFKITKNGKDLVKNLSRFEDDYQNRIVLYGRTADSHYDTNPEFTGCYNG